MLAATTLAALTLTLALLTLLPLLTLLALLPLLALLTFAFLAFFTGLALLAEGVVEELLLTADEVPELVHHLHHLLVLLALLAGHAARLELLQQIAQLTEHLLRILARPLPRHVLDVAHHALEVALAQHAVGRHTRRHLLRRLPFGLAGELLHELVERLAQLVHEPLDLFVGGALLKRLGEVLLGFTHTPLGFGEIAVLEAQRDVPELIDHALHAGARAVAHKPPVGGAQAEIGMTIGEETVRLHSNRVEADQDLIAIAGILDQAAALLDDRPRDRVLEAPLRQNEFDRRTLADLPGLILGGQHHAYAQSGPGVAGKLVIARAFGLSWR